MKFILLSEKMKFVSYLVVLTISAAIAAPSVKIIGGEDASRGEFPYQVSFQYGLFGFWKHICGGTILSKTWIMTAGHCVTSAPAIGDYRIVAGILNLNDTNEERQEIKVVEKVVHPNFTGAVEPNDIALLKLATALEFNDAVRPAKLPDAGSEVAENADLSGWGVTDVNNMNDLSNTLQKSNLPIVEINECKSVIDDYLDGQDNPLDVNSNICTGPLTGGHSFCLGDSGSGLAQNGTVVGVVSWIHPTCGSVENPSVYTKVSEFIDFIKSNVDDLE